MWHGAQQIMLLLLLLLCGTTLHCSAAVHCLQVSCWHCSLLLTLLCCSAALWRLLCHHTMRCSYQDVCKPYYQKTSHCTATTMKGTATSHARRHCSSASTATLLHLLMHKRWSFSLLQTTATGRACMTAKTMERTTAHGQKARHANASSSSAAF